MLFHAIMWSCKPRWVADADCCFEILLSDQSKFEILLSGQQKFHIISSRQSKIDCILQSPATTSWVFYETYPSIPQYMHL